MAKICAVVLNSVCRDARVLREAESLAAAGHELIIVGIADNNFPSSDEVTAAGIRILRADLTQVRSAISVLQRATRWGLLVAVLFLLWIVDPTVGQTAGVVGLLGLAFSILLVRRTVRLLRSGAVGGPIADIRPGGASIWRESLRHVGLGLWFWLRLWPMAETVSRVSPDVVHCHDVFTLPIGVYLKVRTGCRLVYDAHEIYEEVAQADATDRGRCRGLHTRLGRFVDRFITINDSIADWYAKSYPRLPKAVVIMNAARPTELPPYDERLHNSADLPQDARILLYQGGYSTHRGLEVLVESAMFLPERWFLVMMGWGKREEELRGIAERVNAETMARRAEAVVRFIPPAPQEELALWTAGATIGVIPYENTGLNHWFCTPNKLWEYPIAGVPVLVSPFPEMSRMIEAYGHGWLLPADPSPEAIGNAVRSLADSDIAAAKRNASRFVADNHWGVFESRLVAMYADLCR
jgi:glycosyltransferase involved in cell wall biosynthesis